MVPLRHHQNYLLLQILRAKRPLHIRSLGNGREMGAERLARVGRGGIERDAHEETTVELVVELLSIGYIRPALGEK
jgi:hypothetical protein